METKTKTTREAILEQLHENTGAHFLDSGGAYGRHHERNRGKTWEQLAEPAVRVEAHVYTHGDVPQLELLGTVSLAAWMEANLEYSPEVQDMFEAWVQANDPEGDNYDMQHMEEFAASVHTWRIGDLRVQYTYNMDNDLSQDIQFIEFTMDVDGFDTEFVLVQVHQGCDARGGMGSPKAYQVCTEYFGRWDVDMWGCDSHQWGEDGYGCDSETPNLKDIPVHEFEFPDNVERDLENLALTDGNTEANRALMVTTAKTVRRAAFEDFCEALEDHSIVVFDRVPYFVGNSGPEEIYGECSGLYSWFFNPPPLWGTTLEANMAKFEFKGYLHARPADAWDQRNVLDGFKMEVMAAKDMGFCGYTFVAPVNVEIEIPDSFNPRAEYIQVLKEKERKLEEEFHEKVLAIQKQISELSALEFTE